MTFSRAKSNSQPLCFLNGGSFHFSSGRQVRPACKRTSVTAALGRALVVGANRGLGLALSRALASESNAGSTIATVRRYADINALSSLSDTEVVELDVRDRDQVKAVLADAQADVLFSCFGGDVADDDRSDYPGSQNLIDFAEECGIKRYVYISALGASNSESSVPFQVMDTMRPLLLDKSRAELYLKESKLEWTVIRPGPLTDDPATGSGILTQGLKCYGTIPRKELASLLVRAAGSSAAAGATLTAIDRARILLTSPYVRPLEFWEPLPVEEFDL